MISPESRDSFSKKLGDILLAMSTSCMDDESQINLGIPFKHKFLCNCYASMSNVKKTFHIFASKSIFPFYSPSIMLSSYKIWGKDLQVF